MLCVFVALTTIDTRLVCLLIVSSLLKEIRVGITMCYLGSTVIQFPMMFQLLVGGVVLIAQCTSAPKALQDILLSTQVSRP